MSRSSTAENVATLPHPPAKVRRKTKAKATAGALGLLLAGFCVGVGGSHDHKAAHCGHDNNASSSVTVNGK